MTLQDLCPVVPVEALTRATDRFRCEPYRAVLSARTCLERQGAGWEGGRNQHRKGRPVKHQAYPACVACEIGKRVAAQVSAETSALPACTGCGAPVHRASGRAPRCPRCRAGGTRG